ncbi:MAG: fimbria major subunit, partial [Muribaculaceae bacterium]
PAFNAISQADYRKWYQNSAAIEYTMPTGPITITAGTGVTNTPIHYTTENLFKGGYKGNVSYLHITANYTPANFITGINASTATDPAAYTTTAGTANATFFAVIVNGKPTDQLKVAADAFDTDNDAIKAAALWQITRRPVATGQILNVANIAMDNKTTQGWHIVYTSATHKTDKSNPLWYDEVEVKYYFDDSATVTDSFKFYIVKYTDGKCYYRMNIKNLAAGKVALDYYVNRNKFYMITANKFTGLGFAKPGDSTIVPTDPITQDTYVQGEIVIMPWTEVSYGEDVGI